ncbi:peptidoglycan DD-metalloendopeptidase family protein [Streptomyces oceani]|uniref:Peptidase M23 n=1 Tax=Streptomyces oceani TaxID=1075402 RepID=A0A1E7JY15_9ACTN|nr:peptidoglycan DD-metalloendopeptidase family protein [Streptomyces oceani]OEU96568.1 peptidase M23 [Streptomyces oceani]
MSKSGVAWAVGGAAALAFMPFLLFVGMAAEKPEDTTGGGGGLNTKEVPKEYVSWVLKSGKQCKEIGPAVIAAQIEAESGWNPKAKSPVGAEGLSQFMPGTWDTWGRDDDNNGRISPYDAGDAIMAQGRYDCALVDEVKPYADGDNILDLTLAAYNAGPGAVQEYGGMPPYDETTTYVARIKSLISKYEQAVGGDVKIPPGAKMAMPIGGDPTVTSPYGMREHPVTGEYKLHTGIDFDAAMGDPMRASLEGTVIFAGWSSGYGNRVEISHGTKDGKKVTTTYNHMSAITVQEGQKVKTGTRVGAVGSTGYSTGAHCHFEVELDGEYVDPAPWLGL